MRRIAILLTLAATFANCELLSLASQRAGDGMSEAEASVVRVLVETDRWTMCGSGVIITTNGYVLTAAHLLESARRVTVMLRGADEHDAEVVGTHPHADVALIKIQALELPAMPVGSTAHVRDGDVVIVLGHPDCTPAVSATRGRIGKWRDGGGHEVWYDAPIRRGYSGGPVLNAAGDLVAVHFEQPAAEGGGRGVTIETALELLPRGAHRTLRYPRYLASASIPIHCVAFSPCGGQVAAGRDDGLVTVWDVATGRSLYELSGHTGPVWGVCFSPDGSALASGSGDGTVRLWDTASGRPVKIVAPLGSPVYTVTFSRSGEQLAAGTWAGTAVLYDLRTTQRAWHMEAHVGPVRAAAFGPHDTSLALGGWEGRVAVWALPGESIRAVSLEGGGAVQALAFNCRGELLALTRDRGTTSLWRVEEDDLLLSFGRDAGLVQAAAFCREGEFLAMGLENGTTRVWDLSVEKEIDRLVAHAVAVLAISFSPQRELLIAGMDNGDLVLYSLPEGVDVDHHQRRCP